MSDNPLLVAVVGPTASGKSALAMELAKRFDGELICADSRTVYKYMDIGTAKPSLADQTAVKHYGLDLVEPNESYSAARFQRMAISAVHDITTRGKLPIIVGGTGLYVDSVLFDYHFLPVADISERQRLSVMSVDELHTEILEKDLPIPKNENNPRHLMRVIEARGIISDPSPNIRENTIIIGLQPGMGILKNRIEQRVQGMIDSGYIQETRQLVEKYGWDAPGMQSTGYKAFRDYILGTEDLQAAIDNFIRNDYQLARRQRTWFKRNKSIQWADDPSRAVDIVTTFLNKKQ